MTEYQRHLADEAAYAAFFSYNKYGSRLNLPKLNYIAFFSTDFNNRIERKLSDDCAVVCDVGLC